MGDASTSQGTSKMLVNQEELGQGAGRPRTVSLTAPEATSPVAPQAPTSGPQPVGKDISVV